MITKEQRFRLGIFVIATSLILFISLVAFILPKFEKRGVPYYIYFQDMSVNGLKVGSPVKYQGVEIGKVADISISPSDIRRIQVVVEIKGKFPIKQDMTAVLQYQGITFQKFVEISGGRNESYNIPARGEIPSTRGLTEQAEDIIASIDSAFSNLNAILAGENQERIQQFFENAQKSSEVISTLLEKREESLNSALIGIERAAVQFSEVTNNLFNVTQKLNEVTVQVEAETERTFSSLSKRLSDEEMGRVIEELKTFIESATANLKSFEALLIRQQETVTRTFASLEETMDNISSLSRALTEDPAILLRARRGRKK